MLRGRGGEGVGRDLGAGHPLAGDNGGRKCGKSMLAGRGIFPGGCGESFRERSSWGALAAEEGVDRGDCVMPCGWRGVRAGIFLGHDGLWHG